MKKFLIALVAVAAVACSNDQMVDMPKGAAIEFDKAFVENSTRAAQDITKDNIADFGVFGWVEAGEEQGQIFNNTRVYKQDGRFIYDNAQFWIGGAQYYFAAMAPKPVQNEAVAWSYTSQDATNGQISFDNEAAAAQQDLLFDFVTPAVTPESITTTPAPVAFNFNHILSRVKFSFKNGFAPTSNISLEVQDVHITNAYADGTINVANGVLAADWAVENEWNIAFGNTAIENRADAVMLPTDVAKTAHLYLIPTDATYNVTFKVVLYQAGVRLREYNRSASVTVDMERGKSYELKATLDQNNTADHGALSPIEFTVGNINDWSEYENKTIN